MANGARKPFQIKGGLPISGRQRGELRNAVGAGGTALADLLGQRHGLANRLSGINERQQQDLARALGVDVTALPGLHGTQGFGLQNAGFGFAPGERSRLREATGNASALQQLLQNPALAGRFAAMTDQQKQQLANLLRVNPSAFSVGPPPSANPPPAPPAATTPNTPAPSGPPLSVADAINKYSAAPAAGTQPLQNFYTAALGRLQSQPLPSFEDQFKNYLDVANREANRQAAAITESFGSTGNRYSSDLLDAQGRFRSQMAQDIANNAANIQSGLNTQRLGELNAVTGGQLGLSNLDQQRIDNARQLFLTDYIRQTQPPPLLAGAAQFGASFGSPASVVY